MSPKSEDKFRAPRDRWVLSGQIDHWATDLTVIMPGDATLEGVQKKLAENDQWLPIDGQPGASIESLVDTNSTGPLRLGFGGWRDLILGMQFLDGDGRLVSVGGLPLKNVAGYDLCKLMVGQSGVFGKIITVIARTYRRPAGAIVAEFLPDARMVAKIFATALRPQWAMLNAEQLLLGYMGDERTLAYYKSALASLDPVTVTPMDLTSEIKYREQRWRMAGPWEDLPWVFRASVPPTRIDDFVQAAQLTHWVADPAFGIVLGGADEKLTPAFRGAAGAMDGTLRCRSVSEGKLMATTTNAGERAILERLKKAFDNDGKLEKLPTFTA